MISSKLAIESAKVLAEFCKERHMKCSDCPFGHDCLFVVCPSKWKLDRIHKDKENKC